MPSNLPKRGFFSISVEADFVEEGDLHSVFKGHRLGKEDFILYACVRGETFFKLLQLLENYLDVKGSALLEGVVPGDPSDTLHFIIVRFVLNGKLVNGILF